MRMVVGGVGGSGGSLMFALFCPQLKELGVILYNCSCLALDLHRIFSLYWQLQYKDFIPSIWSKRVNGLFNKKRTLPLILNNVKSEVYPSVSTFQLRYSHTVLVVNSMLSDAYSSPCTQLINECLITALS